MQRVQLLTLSILLIPCSTSYTNAPRSKKVPTDMASAAHMCDDLTHAIAQNDTALAYELACKLAQAGHQQKLRPMLDSLCGTLTSEQIAQLNKAMQAHVFIENSASNTPQKRQSTPTKQSTLSKQAADQISDELMQAIEQDNNKLAYDLACKLAQMGHQQKLRPMLNTLCRSLTSEQMEQLNRVMQAHAFIETDTRNTPNNPQSKPTKHQSLKKKYQQLQKELKVTQKESAKALHTLLKQVNGLERNLESRNKRVEQLELTLAISRDQNALPTTITQLQEDLEAAHMAMQKTKHELHAANQALDTELQHTQQELGYTSTQLEQVTVQAQEYATQLMATKDDNIGLYTQLADLTKESETLCRQLQTSKQECSQYLKDLLHTQTYLDETVAAYAKQQHTSEQLADRLSKATQLYHELAVEFDQHKRRNNMASMNKFISKFKKVSWDKINELLGQKKALLQENDQLTNSFKQEREELLAECELYEEHLEKMWEQLKQEQQKTAYVQRVQQQELDELQNQHEYKYDTLSDKYENLNEKYAELSSDLEQQYAWDDQLELELVRAKKEIGKLSGELSDLQEIHGQAVAQMNELKNDKVMVTELYQQLIEENDIKDTQIADLSDKLIESQELWHQNEQLHAQLELKTSEKERFEQQCKKLVNELNQQKKTVQAATKNHQEKMVQLETTCNHYITQLEQKQAELEKAHEKLAHFSKEIQMQSEGMLELQNDTITVRQTYDQQLLAANKDLEAITSQRNELEKTVSQLAQELASSICEHSNTALKLASAQKELDTCMHAYQSIQTNNVLLQKQAQEGLQKAMSMAQQKIQSIHDQSQSLHAELVSAQERQRFLQAQLESKSSLSDHLLVELQESKQQVTQLESAIEVHETQAHRLQRKLSLVEQVLHESPETIAEHDNITPQNIPA